MLKIAILLIPLFTYAGEPHETEAKRVRQSNPNGINPFNHIGRRPDSTTVQPFSGFFDLEIDDPNTTVHPRARITIHGNQPVSVFGLQDFIPQRDHLTPITLPAIFLIVAMGERRKDRIVSLTDVVAHRKDSSLPLSPGQKEELEKTEQQFFPQGKFEYEKRSLGFACIRRDFEVVQQLPVVRAKKKNLTEKKEE